VALEIFVETEAWLVTGEKGCSSASIDSIKMPQGTV
jgi:hypothetical protein